MRARTAARRAAADRRRRAQTLTVLPQLDGRRKGLVVRFLYESGLLSGVAQVTNGVRLRGADLRHAVLRGTRFDRSLAQFGGADWRGADFRDTEFPVGVSFERADLRGADFSRAKLARYYSPSEPPHGGPVRQTPFRSSCLSGARFAHAWLDGVSFGYAVGHGVDFTGARPAAKPLSRRAGSCAATPLPEPTTLSRR